MKPGNGLTMSSPKSGEGKVRGYRRSFLTFPSSVFLTTNQCYKIIPIVFSDAGI